MARSILAIAAFALVAQASGLKLESTAHVAANPIRKVVTLLQNLQKKVEADGKAEQKLYDTYMCYCKNGAGDLEKSIAANDAKIPEVESALAEAAAQKEQLDADSTQHRADREAAKAAMATADALRAKEASAFAGMKSEAESNIGAIKKAVASLEKGMAGFLQTNTAQLLRNLFQSRAEISTTDREDVLAFLAGGATDSVAYAPKSGEITGILKELGDSMSANLADASAQEASSVKSFEGLMSAKSKEVAALTAALEDKIVRSGETAVSIVQMKNDLSDAGIALVDDKKFLADMSKNCATKEAEWAEITKTRSEEEIALADTIKLLNDDDALELFKKVLPSAAASLMQVDARAADLRNRALTVLRSGKSARPQVDFIMLALQGKQQNFDVVVKMIDEMVVLLKKEQTDDDDKLEYCQTSFDSTDDKKKSLELTISNAAKAAADAEQGVASLAQEIKALQDSIEALDKSVVSATEQRQEEHQEFADLMASNGAAIELIGLAKNRMNKFYNKALYKAAPKRELSEEDRIAVNNGGTAPPTPAPGGIAGTGITALAEVSVHAQSMDAPAPPPESPGAYSKKSEGANSVIAMMDLLVADLNKEMQEAEQAEKDAQNSYEAMSSDAAAKRAADASAAADKEGAKANMEGVLQTNADKKASTTKELMATLEFISSLHAECDWNMQNHEVRKEARAAEVESLGRAKAVLSGADYSLLQTRSRSLRVRA